MITLDTPLLKQIVEQFIALYMARNPGTLIEADEVKLDHVRLMLVDGKLRTPSFEVTERLAKPSDIIWRLSGWARPND